MSSEPRLGDEVLPTGTMIGETYRILRRIGSGGMGQVYEVEHVDLPRRFAVKVLRAANDVDLEQRFRQEANIMARLLHPNIVEVVDFRIVGNLHCIVMEHLEGENLAQRLARQRRLDASLAVRIARQVAAALAFAHCAGVVHRDLKPQNIFLVRGNGGAEHVKVLDFGISKLRTGALVLTREDTLIGSPRYMAPEQALGRNAEVTERTDIFALGIVVYEMLTGLHAFPGDSDVQVLHEVVHEEPRPLDVLGFSTTVKRVVGRAMAKRPLDRHRTASAFIQELGVALNQPDAGDWSNNACAATAMTRSETLPFATVPEPGRQRRLANQRRAAERKAGGPPAANGRRRLLLVAVVAAAAALGGLLTFVLLAHRSGVTTPASRPAGPATLILNTTPGGAVVLVDGQPARRTTPTVLAGLAAGRPLRLTLRLPQHLDQTLVVQLAAGEVREVHHTFQVAGRALPEAAGALSDADEPAPGHRRRPVSIGAPRVRPATKKAAPQDPETVGFGRLTLASTPWATVEVDGKPVGVTPLFELRLVAGQHTVSLQNPEQRLSKTFTIAIPKDAVVRRKIALE